MKERTNKNLLFGFILGVALCGACCYAEKPELLLFAAVVPFFCAQLWLLKRTGKLWLRLLPVYPVAALLLAAGYFWIFGKGWDQLAALIFALLSIAPTAGCILAVVVHRFSGRFPPEKWLIPLLVLLGWAGAWFGQEVCLDYWDRAFVKALSFLGCMGLYVLLTTPSASFADSSPARGEPSIFCLPDRRSLKVSAMIALVVFWFLTVGYMALSPWLDLSAVPAQLAEEGTTAKNFPIVAAYITLVNSFLEEVFFRGFAFLALKRRASARFAYLFSGITFALYHVSIMDGWFHPAWFVLFIAALAVAGMLFDALDRKGSIWCGWLVHMAADLAIMLIGMRMFGIL